MFPNFIVIGAAKAGTTALYWYLAEHPQVFMSAVKETNYFAYGQDEQGRLRFGNPELHRFPVRSRDEYLALFADVGGAPAVGEASPIYLECPDSAERIHAEIPQARIICGLRHPVERAYSDYLMYLRGKGLRFDPARDLHADAEWAHPDSHWMQVSRYHDNLARYYQRFPRDNIHIFLFDDLKRDAVKVAQDVYEFLRIDPTYQPDTTTPYNVGGVPGNMLVERAFMVAASMRRAVEPLVPTAFARALRRLRAANMQKAPRLPMELKAGLTRHFEDDIECTGELIGRDLSGWLPSSNAGDDLLERTLPPRGKGKIRKNKELHSSPGLGAQSE